MLIASFDNAYVVFNPRNRYFSDVFLCLFESTLDAEVGILDKCRKQSVNFSVDFLDLVTVDFKAQDVPARVL